jgi:general secretion pathway protein C
MDLVHKINSLRFQPATFWVNTANQRLPGAVSVVLVIAIAFYLAKLVWVLVPANEEFDWTVKSVTPAISGPQGSQASTTMFRTIVSAHLFGEAGAEPEPVATIDAPETRLNLKLRATIAAPDDSLAHAIIADGKGKDSVYFIKDTVAGGAVLYEIHPDRVILNRGGALETLKLPKISEALGNQPVRSIAGRSGRPSAPAGIPQAAQLNASSFTDILRPQPYMPNGQLKGYRVYPGRDRRRFAALGLRPGDLVTEINGQPLNDLQAGMEVFRSLGDASQLTVTLERNGNPLVLTLDSSEFTAPGGARE